MFIIKYKSDGIFSLFECLLFLYNLHGKICTRHFKVWHLSTFPISILVLFSFLYPVAHPVHWHFPLWPCPVLVSILTSKNEWQHIDTYSTTTTKVTFLLFLLSHSNRLRQGPGNYGYVEEVCLDEMSFEEERRCDRIGEKEGNPLVWQVSSRSRILLTSSKFSSNIWRKNRMLTPPSNSPPFLPQDFCTFNNFSPESKCRHTYARTSMF